MQVYHLNIDLWRQAFSAPAVALYQRLGDTDAAWYARVRRGHPQNLPPSCGADGSRTQPMIGS